MIRLVFCGLLLLQATCGRKLNLEVSSPQEVNSLEQEEPLRSIQSPNSIEQTVKEVENIINSNPALPRLTRGEILDLLENITAKDKQKIKLGVDRKPKAVMVVMPYTPSNDKNIEDFYTKAPITQMIGEPFKTKEEVTENHRRRPPVKFQNFENVKKKYSANITEKVTKATPIRRRRPTVTTTEVAPTTYRPSTFRRTRRTTTTTQHPNHRYTEDFVSSANNGIRIIESPKLSPPMYNFHNFDTELDVQENINHEVEVKPEFPSPIFMSTTTTQKSDDIIKDISFPENLRPVIKDLNLESAISPEAEQLTAKLEEQNQIKHMLASIGVLPKTTTTTTTTSVPNAESVADSLSPEMKDLLMSFGLLPDPKVKVETEADNYNPEKAEVSPESYVGFKPLPNDGPSRDDMDALLASFGLGRSARKGKSAKIEDHKKFNFDMVPENLKGIITDLGIENLSKDETTKMPVVEKQHVFNPDTHQYATEEELKKLEKLINVIKQLEKLNGTATEEDLKQIDVDGLKELVSGLNGQNATSFSTLEDQNSPDPTVFDIGSLISKNEIKRQEMSTAASTTTKTESETPSIKDLEASFGGEAVITEPPIPTTTTSKSGFYYLFDWNTFLDIDDTKGKRVNLRFQPTVGDPKRFLSVTVP